MSRFNRLVASIFGAAILAAVLVWAMRGGPDRADPVTVEVDTMRATTGTEPSLERAKSKGTEDLGRGPGVAQCVASRVASAHGTAVVGAVVSWTRLGDGLPDWARCWPFDDGTGWRSATTITETDERGEFSLVPPPGDPTLRSVIWITHPGHAARSYALDRDEESVSVAAKLALETAPVVDVTVSDLDGRPIASATVVQRADPDVRARAELGRDALLVYGLRRESATDSSGRALLASLDHKQVVDAVFEAAKSNVWIGTPPASARLVIGPMFTWSGHVEGAAEEEARADARVELRAVIGGRADRIAAAAVTTDGRFGPISTPWVPCDELQFDLEGSGFVPAMLVRGPPDRQEHVRVVLHAEPGFRFPVSVTEIGGAPVSRAVVEWAWSSGPGWKWATRTTDETGSATLDDAPRGAIWLLVEKAGFVSAKFGLELTSDVSPSYPVQLERGATLRGTVTSGGQPVTDFSIVHRRASDSGDTTTVDFQDRKDGSFRIDGMPMGERSVFAVGLHLPRSASQNLALTSDRESEVKFELDEGVSGSGVVRHALTGEPIVGAQIGNWITDADVRVRRFGARVTTDASGAYSIDGMARGVPNTLEVTHDDFATGYALVRPSGDERVDLGIVSLSPPRELRVRLIPPAGRPATEWQATLSGGNSPTALPFPASGEVEFTGLSHFPYDVQVSRGIERFDSKREPTGGRAHGEIVFDLSRGTAFVVELDASGRDVVWSECWLRVYSDRSEWNSLSFRTLPVPSDGRVVVEPIEGTHLELRVETHGGTPLASMRVRADEVAGRTIRFRLEPRATVVRVVNRRGNPVSGVVVAARTESQGWRLQSTSKANGEAEFEGLDGETADFSLRGLKGSGGVVRHVPLRERAIELVIDDAATLSIRVVDGDTPLPGVSVWLSSDDDDRIGFDSLSTSDSGVAQREGFFAQTYRAEIEQPGLWPTQGVIRAQDPPVITTMQVRRCGSVLIDAKRGGLALAGAKIRVESEEFGTEVQPWIADGRVVASDPRCETDSRGRLRLDGLPRGEYRWAFVLDEGVEIGGRFEVQPQRRVDVDVSIP